MFTRSIVLFFCLLQLSLGLPAVPDVDDEELIRIPRKLFTELIGKRDELVALKYRNEPSTLVVPIPTVPKKLKQVLAKMRRWKNDVVEDASIDEDVVDLKDAVKEGKKSARNLFVAGKEGGKNLIKIIGKGLRIAV
ncbi:hypothetical protein U1Q18_047120 [Sarracenia purpurea var. burkii]